MWSEMIPFRADGPIVAHRAIGDCRPTSRRSVPIRERWPPRWRQGDGWSFGKASGQERLQVLCAEFWAVTVWAMTKCITDAIVRPGLG